MSRTRALFGHRFWVWAAPLAVVVLGILGIVLYQAAFAGNAQVLRRSLDRQASLLEELRAQRQTVERFLETTRAQGDATNILYLDHLATEAERFTKVLREVRQLAARSRLDPTSFVYPENAVEEHGLMERGINFTVEGTYDQLRTFINLLEITDQFIILESVALTGGANERNPTLKIRLGLQTYFVESPQLIGRDDVSPSTSVNLDTTPTAEGEGSDGGEGVESEPDDAGAEETEGDTSSPGPQEEPVMAEEET